MKPDDPILNASYPTPGQGLTLDLNGRLAPGLLTGTIVNADINTAAAIAASKLAGYPTDASKVLLGDGSWAGADVKLFDSILLSDAANINFSTISQAYAHLELWILARTATVAALDLLLVRFNGDTAGNYDWQDTVGSGTTVATAESLAATTCRIGVVPGANPGANLFGLAVVKIPHYTGGKEKIYTAESGSKTGTATGNLRRDSIEGSWRSTAAITQITILAAANLIAGSRATLYGKGA